MVLSLVNNRWFGVNAAGSLTSSLLLVMGRLLMRFSMMAKVVWRISSVILALELMTPKRTFRMVRIWRSHTPPKCEDNGGWKTHSTIFWRAAQMILERSRPRKLRDNSACAPTRFVPLSDQIFKGHPRREMNRKNPLIKVSASKLPRTSICTALDEKHVYTQPYLLTSERPTFT